MPGILISSAPGIAFAVAIPARSGTSGSRRPWITTVGTSRRRSAAVREPDAMIAASCRAVPAGWWQRSYVAPASSRIRSVSAGYSGDPISLKTRAK
jgi:hypothetical protein